MTTAQIIMCVVGVVLIVLLLLAIVYYAKSKPQQNLSRAPQKPEITIVQSTQDQHDQSMRIENQKPMDVAPAVAIVSLEPVQQESNHRRLTETQNSFRTWRKI